MNRSNFGWTANYQNNWCCHNQCGEDGQVVTYRKNIIIKSAGKSQKTQKTSLKKRCGNSITDKDMKHQISNEQVKVQQQVVKHPISPSPQNKRAIIGKPPQPSVQINQIHYAPVSLPNANVIRFTPQKPHAKTNKINFVYNSRAPINQPQNLGVNDLESFKKQTLYSPMEKFQSKTMNTTAYHSQFRGDPYRSTQITSKYTQKGVASCDDSPGLSRDFKMETYTPISLTNRKQSNGPLTSLSSRKNTVLSVNGDSESQQSIAIFDLQILPLTKHGSIQTSNYISQKPKTGHISLKSSMNW